MFQNKVIKLTNFVFHFQISVLLDRRLRSLRLQNNLHNNLHLDPVDLAAEHLPPHKVIDVINK